MKKADVSKLKASLSEYLLRIKSGEEVIVTKRGKPIAKLVPISPSGTIPEELLEMQKAGLVSIGKGKLPKNFWTLPRPQDPKGSVLQALLEEREDGR
ncbi:MAG TPA: type II toxin-antitoxin system prevent-host-death family antitoxin [Nitrospiria bacterium]|jgi:prevent-host-death family protein